MKTYNHPKVIERATGIRNAEGWTFLPDNWDRLWTISHKWDIIFSKSFLYVRFTFRYSHDTGQRSVDMDFSKNRDTDVDMDTA